MRTWLWVDFGHFLKQVAKEDTGGTRMPHSVPTGHIPVGHWWRPFSVAVLSQCSCPGNGSALEGGTGNGRHLVGNSPGERAYYFDSQGLLAFFFLKRDIPNVLCCLLSCLIVWVHLLSLKASLFGGDSSDKNFSQMGDSSIYHFHLRWIWSWPHLSLWYKSYPR